MTTLKEYPLVSVVFVTYKRFDKLKETYEQFLKNCTYPNLELIVADDGSPYDIQADIRKLKFDKYCLSPENKGLGFNQNQGVEAATGAYVLHLQDDWSLLYPSDFLQKAVYLLEQDNTVDFIRFWGGQENLLNFKKIPVLDGEIPFVRISGDRSTQSEEAAHYVYSDRPHLKRKQIHQEIGLYTLEKLPVLKVELDFCKRFETSRFQAAVLVGYEDLFDHTGIEDSFNSHQQKENLRNKINQMPLLGWLWRTYVRLRYGKQEAHQWKQRLSGRN